mmetsp:Transcript_101014/g.261071  ORF Transcript_101014/g.261071 Transcript_101014/m.261071 type:complete len:512 (+) Transcript_101014:146-1681(+)
MLRGREGAAHEGRRPPSEPALPLPVHGRGHHHGGQDEVGLAAAQGLQALQELVVVVECQVLHVGVLHRRLRGLLPLEQAVDRGPEPLAGLPAHQAAGRDFLREAWLRAAFGGHLLLQASPGASRRAGRGGRRGRQHAVPRASSRPRGSPLEVQALQVQVRGVHVGPQALQDLLVATLINEQRAQEGHEMPHVGVKVSLVRHSDADRTQDHDLQLARHGLQVAAVGHVEVPVGPEQAGHELHHGPRPQAANANLAHGGAHRVPVPEDVDEDAQHRIPVADVDGGCTAFDAGSGQDLLQDHLQNDLAERALAQIQRGDDAYAALGPLLQRVDAHPHRQRVRDVHCRPGQRARDQGALPVGGPQLHVADRRHVHGAAQAAVVHDHDLHGGHQQADAAGDRPEDHLLLDAPAVQVAVGEERLVHSQRDEGGHDARDGAREAGLEDDLAVDAAEPSRVAPVQLHLRLLVVVVAEPLEKAAAAARGVGLEGGPPPDPRARRVGVRLRGPGGGGLQVR